jgi:hypothetical protein
MPSKTSSKDCCSASADLLFDSRRPGAQWLREPTDVDRVGQHQIRVCGSGGDLAYVVRECCAGIHGVDEHEGRCKQAMSGSAASIENV